MEKKHLKAIDEEQKGLTEQQYSKQIQMINFYQIFASSNGRHLGLEIHYICAYMKLTEIQDWHCARSSFKRTLHTSCKP